MYALEKDIREAVELTRLPSSQVSMLLNGYLDTLVDEAAEAVKTRLASNRSFAILAHRCAKEALLLATLRELFQKPEEVDEYLDTLSDSTADPQLASLRRGMVGMMLLH